MDVTEDFKYVYTGGRDGNIYEVDILNEKYKLIMGGSKETPIIELKMDELNNRLWYGTPNSDIKCIYLDPKMYQKNSSKSHNTSQEMRNS